MYVPPSARDERIVQHGPRRAIADWSPRRHYKSTPLPRTIYRGVPQLHHSPSMPPSRPSTLLSPRYIPPPGPLPTSPSSSVTPPTVDCREWEQVALDDPAGNALLTETMHHGLESAYQNGLADAAAGYAALPADGLQHRLQHWLPPPVSSSSPPSEHASLFVETMLHGLETAYQLGLADGNQFNGAPLETMALHRPMSRPQSLPTVHVPVASCPRWACPQATPDTARPQRVPSVPWDEAAGDAHTLRMSRHRRQGLQAALLRSRLEEDWRRRLAF